jgi:hypothetical protein
VPRLAQTSPWWAALGGIGASFLATAVVFTLLLPTTLVDFAPLSRERAFEWSGLAGSAAALVAARIAGGWRAAAIVGVWLVAAVGYAISQSIHTYDACLRQLCGLGDYPTSHLDAAIRQWPAAAGAALGLIASTRTWSTRTGTNALLEAAGALAISSGLVAVIFGFTDVRGGPIAVLGEASAPLFIALFVGCLAAAALVIGVRSQTPLLSGARFVAVAIAVEAPHVVAYAFGREQRELKGPVLIAVIPLAAAIGVALVGAGVARLLRSPHQRQHS